MKQFGDLGKTAKKLLTDDYTSETKVKIVTVADSAAGATYTIDTAQNSLTGALGGELSIKGKLFNQLVNSKLHSSGKVSTEVTMDKLGVDGLKLILNAVTGVGLPNAASTKVEYVHKHVAVTGLLDILAGPVATLAIATGHAGLTIGAETQVNLQSSVLNKYDVALSYADSKSSEITLSLLNKAGMVKTAYSHAVNKNVSVAGEVVYNLKDQSKLLTMGASMALDEVTTVKAKINTDGLVGVAYIAKIRPGTTLSLCSALNVKELDKGQKLGMQLAYEP